MICADFICDYYNSKYPCNCMKGITIIGCPAQDEQKTTMNKCLKCKNINLKRLIDGKRYHYVGVEDLPCTRCKHNETENDEFVPMGARTKNVIWYTVVWKD